MVRTHEGTVGVVVHIDRDSGLKIEATVRSGSTVLSLKEQLAKDDPTGQIRPHAFALHAISKGAPKPLADTDVLSDPEVELEAVPLAADRPAAAARPGGGGPWPACCLAALAAGASEADANAALEELSHLVRQGLDGEPGAAGAAEGGGAAPTGRVLLARGLVFWRWSRYERALQDLHRAHERDAEGSALALLALQICLSMWPQARRLAEEAREPEAAGFIEAFVAGTDAAGKFAPGPAVYAREEVAFMPGVRRSDARISIGGGVCLGARLFLRAADDGSPPTRRPLLLYFHGNAETVDSYLDPEVFRPLAEAQVNALIVDFRGYGFSTGGVEPALSCVHTDAVRLVDSLPRFFRGRGLPWPWPGRLALLGRSLGGRAACHLAAIRGSVFDGGVILDSAACGSFAPGAAPPPEPPQDGSSSAMGGGQLKFSSEELSVAATQCARLCCGLVGRVLDCSAEGAAHFVHMAGNEDLLRGFDGELLILHGELDTLIPVGHARRLCDAADAATRRLVLLPKGHNDLSLSDKYIQTCRTFFRVAPQGRN